MRHLLAAIEAGGTSWVAALAWSDDLGQPFERIEVSTTEDPEHTITQIKVWIRKHTNVTVDTEGIPSNGYGNIEAIGVASFGPIDPQPSSPTYGFITSTPKPGWGNTDVLGGLGLKVNGEFAHIPHRFDTDVNAPALAEFVYDKNLIGDSSTDDSSATVPTSSAYVTVGTGVGGGLVVNGATVSGLLHPEAGHIAVRRMEGDPFEGCCPYHGACLEGLVCTRALAARTECTPAELANLPDDHPVWNIAAYYLAQLAASLVLLTSVERIVFGGGVFNRKCLYGLIRNQLKDQLNGYIQHSALTTDAGLKKFVTQSVWGSQAGLVGAAFLAAEALRG